MSACPAGTFAYTVQHGDTLWLLAKLYNTTVEAIMASNPGIVHDRRRVRLSVLKMEMELVNQKLH